VRNPMLWINILLVEEGMFLVPSLKWKRKTLAHEGWVIQVRVHELGYKIS
jgi:hypothetical protein